ncbi:Ribonucleoside-diphosphate reductase 1 subunit alpha [Caulifigura coniformis]|uniref:Ribonucleoside-diphosphate reductase n=1 Tax=Caulifigura coniformis TaxID=2527983 RepID=A0A517SL98_9PLAN|nr:ribonucleoside-diphosphate reductase subunit alpha [Caulifigura coniformis]QDT56903.1 Ribonucleoside-diphosphate reductase 1 subunit alpha [Caulifigura coniformis]
MVRARHEWLVRKRDGRTVPFDSQRIQGAVANAFRAELNLAEGQPLDGEVQSDITAIAEAACSDVGTWASRPEGVDVEKVQDLVEMELMARGHYRVARRYIIYRSEHAKMRAIRGEAVAAAEPTISVVLSDGSRVPFDAERVRRRLAIASRGLEDCVDVDELFDEVLRSVFDGIGVAEIYKTQILAARSRIERDPAYDTVSSRLMRNVVYQEVLGQTPDEKSLSRLHQDRFEHSIIDGIRAGRLSPELRTFDLTRLAQAMRPERDTQFRYLGLQAIYDRYLLHIGGRRIETPQYFWMRVAMGLAIQEPGDREARTIEFYEVLSTFRFTSATPTLFNSGTPHPQLSSCYLSTVKDDLENIFKAVSDNAKLSKWAGGLGNDWTSIRATNAHINGTNGSSQGVIPFLKVVNDAAVAVNQGGKRKGAVCTYLETWHLDIEEFLDLRKNTGDDRRRTHDMHTANWIPDLFLKRVQENGQWTLFSPDEVPDLHDLYGKAFEDRYLQYETLADEGELRMFRRIPASDLWRKMLTRLFETGHPWITFKDPSNIRSPQDHAGVVHSSNLCTEILLNTSEDETAVCNLGSINLAVHIRDGQLDLDLLKSTVTVALRMLDNVIDINYYPTPEAERSNQRHRPIGLGLMGFQDALHTLGISYASDAAVEFADRSMEAISYFAFLASSELARDRGTYPTYRGSKWDRGLLPIDTLELLESERGEAIAVDRSTTLDWQVVRDAVAKHGMRNSNVLAIAPTATISTIIGVAQSIEPEYKHLYAKSNLSGEFTQVNEVLVDLLKSRGLWDAQMLDELKYYDGSVQNIGRIPLEIRQQYLTAFEIEPKWLIECAARRQKWIDQGQSLNLYLCEPSGRKMNDMYLLAWRSGLKTTYYLRTLAATQVEKSTLDVNRFGVQPKWMKNKSASSDIEIRRDDGPAEAPPALCPIDDPTCEACQ